VDCEGRRIILFAEFTDSLPWEFTDVTFAGVVAHHFECVLHGNILFDIEEVEPALIVKDWANLFASLKNYGWPADIPYASPDDLISILRERGVKAFQIGSSYGMTGWVLASTMELVARAAKLEIAH
jgi:hypothetical protein